jgi:hypothetical protein
VAALFARLVAVVYRGSNFTLELKSTVVCDRGPNSAESKWGADFGIVASMVSKEETAEKGVLGQAKGGSLIELVPSQANLSTASAQDVNGNDSDGGIGNGSLALLQPHSPHP